MKNRVIFNKSIYGQTPAHELGHGAFGLKHTFDPEYGMSDNKHTKLFNHVYTNNLNPYKAGAGSYQSEEMNRLLKKFGIIGIKS